MSLIQAMANEHGAWVCTDHRVTDHVTRDLRDDYAAKHVSALFPNGALMIAFAGVGTVHAAHTRREIPFADWICDALRKDNLTVGQAIATLAAQVTQDLGEVFADAEREHCLVVAGFANGQPLLHAIHNHTQGGKPRNAFSLVGGSVQPGHGGYVACPKSVVRDADWVSARRAALNKPGSPIQFSQLLASINRRVAGRNSTIISEHCSVGNMVPGRPFPVTELRPFYMPKGAPMIPLKWVTFGHDGSETMAHQREHCVAQKEGRKIRDRYAEAAAHGSRPKNRVLDKN